MTKILEDAFLQHATHLLWCPEIAQWAACIMYKFWTNFPFLLTGISYFQKDLCTLDHLYKKRQWKTSSQSVTVLRPYHVNNVSFCNLSPFCLLESTYMDKNLHNNRMFTLFTNVKAERCDGQCLWAVANKKAEPARQYTCGPILFLFLSDILKVFQLF